jgi:hypothetical protein
MLSSDDSEFGAAGFVGIAIGTIVVVATIFTAFALRHWLVARRRGLLFAADAVAFVTIVFLLAPFSVYDIGALVRPPLHLVVVATAVVGAGLLAASRATGATDYASK